MGKLTKGDAPDTAQMNARVREMIKQALESAGVQEIFKRGDEQTTEVDIFSDDYRAKIDKIKLPNTAIKLLPQMLAKAIADFKKVNKAKGIDFSQRFQSIVNRCNERREQDLLDSDVLKALAVKYDFGVSVRQADEPVCQSRPKNENRRSEINRKFPNKGPGFQENANASSVMVRKRSLEIAD